MNIEDMSFSFDARVSHKSSKSVNPINSCEQSYPELVRSTYEIPSAALQKSLQRILERLPLRVRRSSQTLTALHPEFFTNATWRIAIFAILFAVLAIYHIFDYESSDETSARNLRSIPDAKREEYNLTPENFVRRSLEDDGVKLYKSVIDPNTVEKWRGLCATQKYEELKTAMQSDANIRQVVKSISDEYVLQDYIWVIQKSAVHTCHRDNNGKFFNEGQKHDSYTMIVYLESMDKCLGVIPGSHRSQYTNAVNLTAGVKDIICSAGDVIIFNANLVHVGTITDKDDNLRVQMKVSHPDDLEVLKYYQNFNKVLNRDNNNPRFLRQIQRGVTCTFPFISDLTQTENIKTARGTDNGAEISSGQKWFSWLFYGRSDFYDLPNAF